jgi:hypothetical protein
MNLMEFSPYIHYAAIGIGTLCIATFLFLSIPEGRDQIATLQKANAPTSRIAKEVLFSVRYLLVGAGILITAGFGLSAQAV